MHRKKTPQQHGYGMTIGFLNVCVCVFVSLHVTSVRVIQEDESSPFVVVDDAE